MEQEKKTDTFEGAIGRNVPSTTEEKEEDLLETLYLWWKDGRSITIPEICIRLNMTKRELGFLLKKMIKHGYLKETEKNEEIVLTAFGKAQGAECLARHKYLTQFLQMVCGLTEDKARENACRMEHVISGEVVQGICDFLKNGDTYDRVIRGMNLGQMYEDGVYQFCMGIYRTEKRYPRILADEFDSFSELVTLEVNGEKSSFCLQKKQEDCSGNLWYQCEDGWKRAESTEKGFHIPTEIFAYTISPASLITEGDGMIAFTNGESLPKESDCRELNLHIW